MPRPKLRPGEHGRISAAKIPGPTKKGRWRARARVGGLDGREKQVTAIADTRSEAEDSLKKKLARISGVLDEGMTIKQLLDKWHAWALDGGKTWRPQTGELYKQCIDSTLVPLVGALQVEDITTGILEAQLKTISAVSLRRRARVILIGAFDWAVRRDMLPRNPAAATSPVRSATHKREVLTPEQFQALRAGIIAWQSKHTSGPPRAPYLVPFLDILIGTGMRPNEALGLRWQDIDLEAGTVTVSGTLVRIEGKIHRQERTKSDSGYRTLEVPTFVLDALHAQHEHPLRDLSGLVFPNYRGGFMDLANVRRALRSAVKGSDLQGVFPYQARHTFVTALEAVAGLTAASVAAGHSSTQITESIYVHRPKFAGDYAAALKAYKPK